MRMLELNSWRQTGVLHLWRYTENVRNYPGWHLATDLAGHASFLDLLTLLKSAAESRASRTVKPTIPSAEVLATANNRRSPVVSPTRVRIAASGVADHWTIAEVNADVTIELGVQHLDGIIRWLSDPAAAFDTTYGSAPPLWFWGLVGAKTPGNRKRADR